ncbi:MAG: helix-turn-helix domain-containing protein [Hyphomicrobiaceae bacterium]
MSDLSIVSLGEKFRKLRTERNLDQYEMAQVLGVAQSTYCDWEKGKMRPRRERLPSIAKAFNVPVAKLRAWWMAS